MAPHSDEDQLAYFRDAPSFRNFTLLELPHSLGLVPGGVGERDYGVTIVRNFLYSAYALPLWEALMHSNDATLAGIAAKSAKETQYHLRHSHDWLVRLGDGTDASHQRVQDALDYLYSFTQEFWVQAPYQVLVASAGVAPAWESIQTAWQQQVDAGLTLATLRKPPAGGHLPTGHSGLHSEHLSYLLSDMQSLARAHPGAVW
jgi:ring-1,2-phenylacetyl-CoA epoxidase subunit PaaC